MLRFADLVEKNTDELAALETWDNGKTYEQAIGEVEVLARLFRYYAGQDWLSICLILEHTFFSCISLDN